MCRLWLYMELKLSSSHILDKAIIELEKMLNERIRNELKDNYGKYAIITDNYVLVAKKYIYTGYVSVQPRAIMKAFNDMKKLIIFIEEESRFLIFNPEKILDNYFINDRGNITMMNFKVELCEKSLKCV